jgi:hypothetical protein
MNVIRSDVRRQKNPSAVQTDFPQSAEDRHPAVLIQVIRLLIHLFELFGATLRAGFRECAAEHVVMLVHNIGFVTVQMRAIAG